jgi:hypothetical protein
MPANDSAPPEDTPPTKGPATARGPRSARKVHLVIVTNPEGTITVTAHGQEMDALRAVNTALLGGSQARSEKVDYGTAVEVVA